MKRRIVRLAAGLCGLIALIPSAVALTQAPAADSYVVRRVVDGDTVVLERIGTVRLIGVDTPETVDPRQPVQRFGREASEFTRRLVEGKRVRVEYDWNRRDDYNRTLAYLYLLDGTLVNAEIIRQGYGFAYTRFPFKYLEAFVGFQTEARNNQRGLWAPNPRDSAAEVLPNTSSAGSNSELVTVYVTRTGTKYHLANCRFVARSRIAITLPEAIKRHEPCEVCRPPVP